ncbi:hypothetical protein BH11PAT3_BH11PAT3_1510 [soil metagenome]
MREETSTEVMYKKIILLLLVVVLSISAFAYHEKLIESFKILEQQSTMNPFKVAGILIMLKSIAAPLGIPGTPLTLITGSIFGLWIGTLVALIGNTIGATLAFLLARYIFQDYGKKLFKKNQKLEKYVDGLEKNGLGTVLFLRLVPLFPFNVINFLLGVTPIPLKIYIVGSFIGMIPGTFLFVYLSRSLRMLSLLNIGLSILGIIALTFIGKYYEKRYK